jgi:uncharacterized protein YyaL (SSP411 family)
VPNRLAKEASTYLQQHADNPVDWWPWCPEALALARDSGRPILLSIGYAACHWCHVMAHESFEDEDTAAVMNALFVNIKVDRQERPDLDQVYQSVHQAMAGRGGGWPLTVFLAPDLTPIHAGTYYPKAPRFGLPSFTELLNGVANAVRDQPGAIAEQGQRLRSYFATRSQGGSDDALPEIRLASGQARDALMSNYDARRGGFGGAPKFPQPTVLDFLLRQARQQGDTEAKGAVLATLRAMAQSGLNDPLAGGFFRYSVDADWAIPHFEKMLYDNALLLPLYANAWAMTQEPLFERICTTTVAWLLAEMRAPAGGFFAAIDADSEGEEGRFYVWQRDELKAMLGDDDWPVAALAYGLDQAPNFEGVAWHLSARMPAAEIAQQLGRDEHAVDVQLEAIRARCHQLRAARIPPAVDRQRLTAWNALAVSGLLAAGVRLGRPEWIDAAKATWSAIVAAAWQDGRLMVTLDPTPRPLPGYLDDHAFALAAAIELLANQWSDDTARIAGALADRLVDNFQSEEGKFFTTGEAHETLFFRPGSIHDQALPAGAAVALAALQTWATWTADERLLGAVARGIAAHRHEATEFPAAATTFWSAARPPESAEPTVVIRGPVAALGSWRETLDRQYLPGLRVVWSPNERVMSLAPGLEKPPSPNPAAWWCTAGNCLPEIANPLALLKQFETLLCNMK